MTACFALLTAALIAAPSAEGAAPPRLSRERLVLHTDAGDLVVALYPDVAPKTTAQLLTLAKAHVYDGVHFHRVHPGFLVQITTPEDRTAPLTPAQRALIHKLPAELGALKHARGRLVMARPDDDLNGAETSFSILLGDAPHLDGKYTLFGEVTEGMPVLDEMLRVPRDDAYRPSVRIGLKSISVVDRPEAVASIKLQGPTPLVSKPTLKAVTPAAPRPARPARRDVSIAVIALLVAMVLSELARFFFSERLTARTRGALGLLNVLLGGFALLLLAAPLSREYPAVAVAVFFGLLGLFKAMGRFESAP